MDSLSPARARLSYFARLPERYGDAPESAAATSRIFLKCVRRYSPRARAAARARSDNFSRGTATTHSSPGSARGRRRRSGLQQRELGELDGGDGALTHYAVVLREVSRKAAQPGIKVSEASNARSRCTAAQRVRFFFRSCTRSDLRFLALYTWCTGRSTNVLAGDVWQRNELSASQAKPHARVRMLQQSLFEAG